MNDTRDTAASPAPSLPLDAGFTPPAVANRAYRKAVEQAETKASLAIALERESGCVSRGDVDLLAREVADSASTSSRTLRVVERHIKFLLWSRGGWKLTLQGPPALCQAIAQQYAQGGVRAFDADIMGKIYDKSFTVEIVTDPADVPPERTAVSPSGGHLDGCRIGFDLGASDYKLAAVVDGEAVFSTEIPWDPVPATDPAYHYGRILDGLEQAAAYMPRVDAIGGSAAGVYVANRVKVASLFRGIPEDVFAEQVTPMFLNIQRKFDVPLTLANDGDVTALAGAMSLGKPSIVGIAMGSSEAAGYLDPQGHLTGYLNELAFAPVDFNPAAARDEWSGDRGVGASYFSQQAVNRLAPAAGFTFADDMPVPERLKALQAKADGGDTRALELFETLGVYLAYTIPHYADYYDFDHLLLLGRVTSGQGGERLIAKAKETLASVFPDVAGRVSLHVPDEKTRRVGQAVAAASLPEIG
jgi:predicted NBD/HSP70 family sugar kinase